MYEWYTNDLTLVYVSVDDTSRVVSLKPLSKAKKHCIVRLSSWESVDYERGEIYLVRHDETQQPHARRAAKRVNMPNNPTLYKIFVTQKLEIATVNLTNLTLL